MTEQSQNTLVKAGRLNSDITLASLAYINVTWETNHASYVDNFVPFVLEILRLSSDPKEALEIRESVSTLFGLDFPTNVIKSLIDRGVRRRKIVKVQHSQKFRLDAGVAVTLPDISRNQADSRRMQNSLVNSLVSFASERFELKWAVESADQALLQYIEQHVLPLLVSSVKGAPYSSAEAAASDSGYVISSFIAHVFENDPQTFGYLDQMIKGSMLAAALYVETRGQVARRFRDTKLYLDAPICLRALGHEGPEAREAVVAMLGLARGQGAELSCFEHTLKEMRGILRGARTSLGRTLGAESYLRGVSRHYRESGGTPSDLDLAIESLERDIQALRIQIVPTPEHTILYGIDEDEFEEVLQATVGYRERSTLRVDLDSLSAIHRIRQGRSSDKFETCRAVLITDNYNLVKASRLFFDSGRHEWPLAMLDNAATTLLWIKEPTSAPELPRRQVIADCYAALAPSASLWDRLLEEVDRLDKRGAIDSDAVALLQYSREAQHAIMDVTYGEPRNISEASVSVALGRARAAVTSPVEGEREKAILRAERAEEREIEARFGEEQGKAQVRDLQDRLQRLEAKGSRAESVIRSRIMRRAEAFGLVAKLVGGICLVVSGLFGAGTFVPSVIAWLPGWSLPGVRWVSLVVFLTGLLTLWRGRSITEWIDGWRDSAIERALGALEPDQDAQLPDDNQ